MDTLTYILCMQLYANTKIHIHDECNIDEMSVQLLCALVDCEVRIVSEITAWGVQWTALPNGPRT